MHILAFGQIADITGSSSWLESDITDTDFLKEKLSQRFPQLKELNYVIAVDKTVVQEKTFLNEDSEIALLPPYSGG